MPKYMFPNKIADTLFSYKGKITVREYKAMLIVILSAINMMVLSNFAAVFLGTEPDMYFRMRYESFSDQMISRMAYNSYSLLPNIARLIILYCPIVITIKRCRAMNLPIAVGWILGILVSSSISALMTISTNFGSKFGSRNFTDEALSFIPILLVLVAIGVIVVIYLARWQVYDYENEKVEPLFSPYDYGLDTVTYLLKIFNLGVIITLILTVLSFISQFSYAGRAFANVISLLVLSTYIILAIRYLLRRMRNAAISYWWIWGLLLATIICVITFFFTRSTLPLLAFEFITIAQFVLIAMPTKTGGEESQD